MAQTKFDLVVSFLGGAAAVSGLSMIRQSTEQLKASLKDVQFKRELGQDLLTLKARFNEVTRSGSYTKEEVRKVTRELADMTAKARDAGLNVGKLTTEMKRLRAAEQGVRLRVSGQNDIQSGRQIRTEAYGQIMSTAASAYTFYKPLDVASRYEDSIKDISITGQLTKPEEAELAKSIRGLSLRYNQAQNDLGESMKKLVETGMSFGDANALMPLMAKTATATRTDSGDAAKMARSFQLLGVKDMELAFNQAAAAGKRGSFELRDMAKWFPALGGMMKAVGVQGNEAVVSMAARMQIATRTAGSNDEAANNFKNFLSKLTSQDTIKDFKKQGIDLIPQLQAAARHGIDPIAAGVELVMNHVKTKAPEAAAELKKVAEEVAKITDPAARQAEIERRSAMIQQLGERAGIGDVFQDLQAVSYLLAEMQNKAELNKLQGDVATGKNEDGSAVLDADYKRRTEGMAEKIKGLKIAITDFGIALGNAMMPVVDFMMPIITGLTRMTTALTETFPLFSRLVFGVLAGASAMSVLGLAMKFMGGGMLSTVGMFKDIVGWLLTTRLGMAANIRVTGLYQAALSGLRTRIAAVALSSQLAGGPMALLGQVGRATLLSLAGAARAFGLALLTTPIGWIAAAVAGLAFLIWKYWKPIKGFFVGLWDGLKTGFQPVMDTLRPALAALRGAFGNLMTAIQPLMPLLKVLFFPILLPVKLVVEGVKMLWGWLKNLFTPVEDVGNAGRNMGEKFGKGIAGVLTWGAKLLAEFLKLPARMIQIGADIINGLVGGLTEGWAKLSRSVGELASGIKDKFKAMLGIHSPSRVFMDFGLNIGEGAAQGITKALSGVQGAAGKMAGVALAGAVAASGHAVAGIKEAAQMLPAVQIGAPAAAGRGSASGQAMAGMSIQFSPTITIGGDAGGDVKGQVQQAMNLSLRELEQMMRRIQAEQQRRAF